MVIPESLTSSAGTSAPSTRTDTASQVPWSFLRSLSALSSLASVAKARIAPTVSVANEHMVLLLRMGLELENHRRRPVHAGPYPQHTTPGSNGLARFGCR